MTDTLGLGRPDSGGDMGTHARVTDARILVDYLKTAASSGAVPGPQVIRHAESVTRALEQAETESHDLESLCEIARGIASSFDLTELLETIIDKVTSLVEAERGFVVLAGPSAQYRIAASRHYSEDEVDVSEQSFSTSLVSRVMSTREPVLTTNIQEDGRFELSQSIITQQIRSVIVVPLVARGDLIGAVYVDTRMSERLFDKSDLRLLEAMASQAALAIRNARLYQDVSESNSRLRSTLDELQSTQEQLLQAERLAAVGRLAASVAHELRNPLMVMRSSLFFLDRLLSSDKEWSVDILKRYLGKVDSEIDRQTKIINDLLFFSRNRPRSLVDVDLNAILSEAVMRVTRPESVNLSLDLDPDLPSIRADGDQVEQVFVNLISNAVQAMPDGGHLNVSTWSEDVFAVAQVTDTGVGISDEHLSGLFEPFFTTKDHGIGLGLSVTKSIVDGHRGRIDVESTVGHGTTFSVRFPYELMG